MSRPSRPVTPRVVATALFMGSLTLFGSVALSLHPALADMGRGELARAVDSLFTDDGAAADATLDPVPPLALQGADREEEAADAPAEPSWVRYTIKKGDTLGKVLPAHGMPTRAVLEAAKPHHDLSKLRVGEELEFLIPPAVDSDDAVDGATAAPAAQALRMELSQDRTLLVQRTETLEEGASEPTVTWEARLDEIIYERRQGVREFVVESTLWGAAVRAGLQPADIVGLANVYRYDIDFNSEVRQGARARMVVEELWLNNEFVRLGAPLAVRFENKGEQYVAIRYEDGDRDAAYYDDEGKARKKPFLRSPLKFSRVTSGFNPRRFHPVLKKRRPHNGVDFGAPEGTPVYAVGNGKVTTARVNGGHGRFVKIDHAGPYASSYSHLSRIAVRSGQTVKQGQIVGYVGSTGLATGPHLHYQFWKNGKYVNPLTVKLPNDGSQDVKDRKGFAAWRDRLLADLDAGQEVQDTEVVLADAE